ncbi:Flp pilus assembly protein TadG [Caulobacter sp. AP07]|uniref:TadE/TadG family type IV pilus assembly protein n=1 Tax=Caulobacter sp. AP07 TaxID=1144304 RepID=UPI000272018D|nr:TadE/TadG family type IV pilus assembly protein [Caulobacter sp. AP07]EJL32211.1 Flp pilus assembly protein TadG [Caulobacter sp. AP07]
MTMLNRLAMRLRADARGAVAIQFALLVIPIGFLTFSLLDIGWVSVQKRQMQDALDAATLMAARSTATTSAAVDLIGDAAFATEMDGLGVPLTAASSTFSISGNTITGAVSVDLKPIVTTLWTNKDSKVTVHTEVVRASQNLEVALVLDTTGSMSGSRITDLKTGAADLVDLVVRDIQAPYYSKVALVPYSAGVLVDTYADAARGPVRAAAISGAAWQQQAPVNISAITKANLAVFTTSAAHGLPVGATVYIKGVVGMTQVNNKIFTVAAVPSTTSFKLTGVNSTNYTKYTSGGTVTRCRTTTCSVVVTTSTANGFITGDLIEIANMKGMTELNGKKLTISKVDATSFDTGQVGPTYGTYTSDGTATCDTSTTPGCRNFTFTNASGGTQTWALNTCATERTGTEAYTDAAPSTSYVGRNYWDSSSSSNNTCPKVKISPLSSDKVTLKAEIAKLAAAGSTAGQVGLAWGWYMVSPNFNELWSQTSQKPAPYGTKELMKVVILMTDGAFNTNYCNGVIAKDAGSGSGSSSQHINCNATNGDAFAQANTLCENIKAKGIILYTVGFDVGDDAAATSMLTTCATDKDHAFFPATGADLKTAFRAIGQEISSLRIAK